MNYILSAELTNKLLTYLAKRPYEEVSEFIQKLTTLQAVNLVSPEDKVQEVDKKDIV